MKHHFVELPVSTRDGRFTARYSENGLAELDFPKARSAGRADRTTRRGVSANNVPAQIRNWHRTTESALKKILAGRKPAKFPPFDAAGTEFQKSVWREMREIPPGKTKSYGEIAQAIGRPKAVRAVGGACGANPIPVLVPCHRILAANQKIGGFSGGLDWKRRLLIREGVRI
ncbi:MAG TPA: methylated-DNA--[protein]-cysteine S-methyltransferase [Verrucomicrobiae bacterium]|nr:methylated-DNA--[protein]-cysteine S-methyltransferase [Verrucomicrobiae bacterium]